MHEIDGIEVEIDRIELETDGTDEYVDRIHMKIDGFEGIRDIDRSNTFRYKNRDRYRDR